MGIQEVLTLSSIEAPLEQQENQRPDGQNQEYKKLF
jgi:hypothetical protein